MTTVVIGNSHAKAIKQANTRIKNPIGINQTYFARSWKTDVVRQGEHSRTRLLALPQQDGDFGIFLDEYDNFIVSAGGWFAARNQLIDAKDPSHPLGYMACAGWGFTPGNVPARVRITSVSVFRATVEAWIRQQSAVRLVQHLVSVSRGQVILQPWPPLSRALKEDTDWIINKWYGENGSKAWFSFFTAQYAALENIASELGARVVLLGYPLQDSLEDGFMDASLCSPDPFHANWTYGALVLDQIAPHVS